MPQVLFARVPDNLASMVKELAARNGRSLNAELIIAVESHLRRQARTPEDAQVLGAILAEGHAAKTGRIQAQPARGRPIGEDIATDGARDSFPFGRWR
jgi:hypothetical protein